MCVGEAVTLCSAVVAAAWRTAFEPVTVAFGQCTTFEPIGNMALHRPLVHAAVLRCHTNCILSR